MSFIQIVDARTKNFDELQALGDQYFQASEGKRTLRRGIVTRDRNDPDRYLILSFFDSYESAMENSNLPETSEFAERQMKLVEGPPRFIDLDVIEDRT
jgi:heme-degrading monooxygenase HmoA